MFRVKICGLKTAADALACVQAGADAVGLNFYPPSKRFVPLDAVPPILANLPRHITRVGVFVNATFDQMTATARAASLDLIQLHGDEPPELAAQLIAAGLPVLRALRCRRESLAEPLGWLERLQQLGARVHALLLDAPAGAAYGGTGQTADWALVDLVRAAVPGVPIVLAGGLTPQNVALAIRSARPEAVDTASGVESAPGQKDPALIAQFVANSRKEWVGRSEE